MALFYQPDLSLLHLTPEESHHAVRVLRLRIGQVVELTDGKGTFATAGLTNTDERKVAFRINGTRKVPKRSFQIHLAIAPTKNIDRMEWLVEKCTEIGIDKITFVKCKTSERPSIPLERLQKLTIGAMKQSQQAYLPAVIDMMKFHDFLDTVTETQRFIGHVDENNPVQLIAVAKPRGNYVLLIGPEGDFTMEEVEAAKSKGFQKVGLGPNRLRTETAGLFGVSLLNALNTQ